MIKNFNQLEFIITNSSRLVHIVVICEANISQECTGMFEMEDYTMYSELRTAKKGGGIIIYVHKSVTFTRKTAYTCNFECVIGEILTSDNSLVGMCAVYRPPSLCKNQFITELSNIMCKYPLNKNYILLGDVNIDLKTPNTTVNSYLNKMYELGLECGISQYTRIEKKLDKITKSCIDHIFMRDIDTNKNRCVRTAVINNALADHFITGLSITDNSKNVNGKQYKYITKLDNDKVRKNLENVDWNQALNYQNPNDILNFITENFNNVYDNSRIEIKINTGKRKQCAWNCNSITKMCKKRDELFAIWKKNECNLENRILYNRYRNKTNKHINKMRNNYTKKTICENFRNPKKMWEVINKLCGRIVKSIDDTITKAFKNNQIYNITNRFAEEFQNNVKNICNPCSRPLLNEETYINVPNTCMRIKKISDRVVQAIIKNLNDKKSPGSDGIRAWDIKSINSKITPAITHLINACITTSIYPNDLKLGIIRPVHKKGSFTDINNYRPITILSCIDKIVEKYFGHQLNQYLSLNKIIHDNQYGFQQKKNTVQLLSKFTNEVNGYLNAKQNVLAIFVDFSKAFETLNYPTLYQKLQQGGIQGPLLEWFKDYHTNRYTSVSIAGTRSKQIPTEVGSAQGSILAPTEYLLYVNDMCKIFKGGSVYQFADDTCLLYAHKDVMEAQKRLQLNYDTLCKWAHDVGLVINAQKTKLMHIHSPHLKITTQPKIVAHEHQCMHQCTNSGSGTECAGLCNKLDLVEQHTYLGMIIDTHFNWGPHIESICKRLRAIMGKLVILKQKLPYDILRLLYLSLADSIMSYGLDSYGRTYKTYIDNIYKIQLKTLKNIIPNKIKIQYKGDNKAIFDYCKILDVYNKTNMLIICEEINHIHNLKRRTRPKHLRSLEYMPTYFIPRYSNDYGRRTTQCLLPQILNEIPNDVIDSISIDNHKCKTILKKYYQQRKENESANVASHKS